jgi:hypothetical protein
MGIKLKQNKDKVETNAAGGGDCKKKCELVEKSFILLQLKYKYHEKDTLIYCFIPICVLSVGTIHVSGVSR